MDKTKERTRLEEILAEWDMDNQDSAYEPVTCPVSDTITINSALKNVSITSPYTVSLGSNWPNAVYTTAGTNTSPWFNSTSAKIQLDDPNADITVRGWSLVDAVKRIEERLGLYQPNPELEKEWSELRELGEQYKKLEQHIRDKQATWDRLKAMPAPEIE